MTGKFRHVDGIRSNSGDDVTVRELFSLLASSARMRIDLAMRTVNRRGRSNLYPHLAMIVIAPAVGTVGRGGRRGSNTSKTGISLCGTNLWQPGNHRQKLIR